MNNTRDMSSGSGQYPVKRRVISNWRSSMLSPAPRDGRKMERGERAGIGEQGETLRSLSTIRLKLSSADVYEEIIMETNGAPDVSEE